MDTKIEEYSQNSLPNPSAEEKTTRDSVPWKKYRSKLLEFRSERFCGPAQHKTRQPKISIIVFDVRVIIEAVWCEFRKTSFFRGIPFHSVPFRASELALPRNSECLGMSTFFRGITEIIPSLFRGIFLNEIPFPTLAEHARKCLKVEYLGRIEYDFQKSRVTGPKVSVSAKKVKKKISCLCTFTGFKS